MKAGMFIPCYVDQFYPRVAIATLELLEKLGIEVDYPLKQTCCGQPMANAGYANYGKDTENLFVSNFQDFDYIVTPSGSCALHVKDHFAHLEQTAAVKKVRASIFELVEFLTDIVKVAQLDAHFPYKVGYHASCHGLRGLHLGSPSERRIPSFSKAHQLLQLVKDIELVELDRSDECCGFGGTFAVAEEAISVKMGKDRIADHRKHGAEVITGGDMSCLMHLEGLLKRQKSSVKVMHIAEILNYDRSP